MEKCKIALGFRIERRRIKIKEYWIDFCGYVKVEAEDADDAVLKFSTTKSPFRDNSDFSNDVWEIESIKEITDNDEEVVFRNPNAPSLQDLEDFWNDK